MPDYSDVPTIDASWPIAEATDDEPAVSAPRMPPPASLMAGEERAEDGGVQPITTEYSPVSGPVGRGSDSSESAQPASPEEALAQQVPVPGVNRHPHWVPG